MILFGLSHHSYYVVYIMILFIVSEVTLCSHNERIVEIHTILLHGDNWSDTLS